MIQGFHLEPTNICTLKCSGCARTRFIEQWPQHWRNHSLDIDQLLKFLDIDLHGINFLLNGTYGDPIYHPDFINFVDRLKQRGAYLHITTNGSYQRPEWWTQLVGLLDSNDTLEFSIDGIPENFTQYRVNADWKSIEQGIRIAVAGSCHTIWKFIPFEYNQLDINTAQEISQNLGIKEFLVRLSDRFDERTEHLIPDSTLLRDRYQSMIQWKKTQIVDGITPKCNNNSQHYISAEGFYIPCCWLGDHRFYYKSLFGKSKNMFDIKFTTISQLLKNKDVTAFFNNLDKQPGCQYNCPKVSAY